jgi:predicted porin
MKLKPVVTACLLMLGISGAAHAADSADMAAMKQQMEMLQQQLKAMQSKMDAMAATQSQQAQPAASVTAAAPGESPLTAHFGGASVTLYGNADLSAEVTNNGKEKTTQVSSNLSYLGVRAHKPLGDGSIAAIAQFETLVNVSGTPTETSGLGSRNSYVGLQGGFGKVMFGKYDTPYKRATAAMDPFASSVGDYNSIMGNTGGDLRAEFDLRMPHAIFWDSPVINGFSANLLFSPSQKLHNLSGADNYAFPQGEKVCSGATPGSSGSTPDSTALACNDGAFGNAYSMALNYEQGPLYATIAYEKHQGVDRTGDTNGVISDESAVKIGGSYKIANNKISAIWEKMNRGGGIDPAFNERARKGYYLSDVFTFAPKWDLLAAWAHAAATPGGPDFGTIDDKANMYALGLKYRFDKQTALYAVGAILKQGDGAHYALGASGHGVPIASPRDENGDTIPGQTLRAISVGMQYVF